jgi:hypothetical protein
MASKDFMKGKYTESKDKKKDAVMTKGMSAADKKKFETMDKKHAKPKSMKDDAAKDKAILDKLKAAKAKKK